VCGTIFILIMQQIWHLMMMFWILAPRRLVGRCQHFGETLEPTYESTWLQNSEEHHPYHHTNLKSHKFDIWLYRYFLQEGIFKRGGTLTLKSIKIEGKKVELSTKHTVEVGHCEYGL
jgi:hypothetical protein